MQKHSFVRWSGCTAKRAPEAAFDLEIIDDLAGQVTLRIVGKGASALFAHESGGHRFERVPPNEKRGRVHSSLVTVAVLDEPKETSFVLDMKEVEKKYTKSSGPGGQHANKVETVCVLKHLPTGIQVRASTHKSRWQNEQAAYGILRAKLAQRANESSGAAREALRRSQVGVGDRAGKRRTYRYQDDRVIDHLTERRASLKKILRGGIDLLHPRED